MKLLTTVAGTILLGMFVSPANSQAVGVDHFTQDQLVEKAKSLKAKAGGGTGIAGESLHKYPNHFTMLTYRSKSGKAELHEKFSDIFFVVDGHATLLSGGTIEEKETVSPGEASGKSVKDGSTQELNRGDIIHISANVPHQLLIAPNESFTYFVIKVQEKP